MSLTWSMIGVGGRGSGVGQKVRTYFFSPAPGPRPLAPASTGSSQQINKDRRADERRDDADVQFARRNHGARQGVGEQQEAAARQRRGRDDETVVAAADQPHGMRNDQADEA